MTATLILGIVLSMIPVIIVYLLFLSFNVVGASLVLIFIAIYIMKGPGAVEYSYSLIEWQKQQDLNSFNIGDLAYARVSQKTIKKWIQNLIIIGLVSNVVAPWGEEIPIALAYITSIFIGYTYENIFVPISGISMPFALTLFFMIGPLLIMLAGYAIILLKKKILKD